MATRDEIGNVIGMIEMQPVRRCVEFRDPSRGDKANWRSFLAECNQVPEDDIRDLEFGEQGGFPVVRFKIAVHFERPEPRAVLISPSKDGRGPAVGRE